MTRFTRFVQSRIKQKYRDIAYKTYITDMLKALVEKHGLEVSGRWYDLAFDENIPTLEDERQKALEAFARG